MDLNKDLWTKKNYQEFVNYLKSIKDEEYKKFSSSLTNTKYEIVGIQIPRLRNIAKEILKGNYLSFLEVLEKNCLEELFIEGFLISKLDNNLFLKKLDDFVSKIDDWSVCDTFCGSLKFIKKNPDYYFDYIANYLESNKPFEKRFSYITFKMYYINDNYINIIIDKILENNSDDYYVLMGICWLLAEIYLYYPEKVIELFRLSKLNTFVNNKTISKICDSKRVTIEEKIYLKSFRRSNKL